MDKTYIDNIIFDILPLLYTDTENISRGKFKTLKKNYINDAINDAIENDDDYEFKVIRTKNYINDAINDAINAKIDDNDVKFNDIISNISIDINKIKKNSC